MEGSVVIRIKRLFNWCTYMLIGARVMVKSVFVIAENARSKFFSPLEGRNRVQGWRTFCTGSSTRPLNLAVTE